MSQKSIDDYLLSIGNGKQDKGEKPPVIKTKSVLEGADNIIITRTEHFNRYSEIREKKSPNLNDD
ncbi:hypothetical protein HUB98_09405 [Paenibacillus barcinonensis]|uniref:Uncharacterized protein n=1 Tax=Paenibacillus barcinonensis TaxID=198119 RepID=A0A2V4VX60_PAEBA|nr:hypothetical protein [Paenibacillus barcinonensis]PYE49778.1 hypothetical protein DFQ00_105282 [Paenibacillus barcinonensis]QKS56533.1 hypothetical protein HUB98_09405 [Paenibacillus barcinonensis]